MRRSICVAAFSLVEVTLALGIAAFCLIAVFGLVPVGVQTNRNATSQTRATNIMTAVVSDLRATPNSNTTSTQFNITFGTCKRLYFNSEGQIVSSGLCDQTISVPPTSRYQVDVTWSDSGWSGLKYADVKVIWPPTVVTTTPTPIPSGSTEMFAAFDRN